MKTPFVYASFFCLIYSSILLLCPNSEPTPYFTRQHDNKTNMRCWVHVLIFFFEIATSQNPFVLFNAGANICWQFLTISPRFETIGLFCDLSSVVPAILSCFVAFLPKRKKTMANRLVLVIFLINLFCVSISWVTGFRNAITQGVVVSFVWFSGTLSLISTHARVPLAFPAGCVLLGACFFLLVQIKGDIWWSNRISLYDLWHVSVGIGFFFLKGCEGQI